jgi:hypothetical protein
MEQVWYGGTDVDGQPEQPAAEVERGGGPVRRGGSSMHQRGMVSAEWAVGIVAAIAIAGVLLAVVTTGQVKAALLNVVLTVIATFAKYAH